jgi:hypothetical protein
MVTDAPRIGASVPRAIDGDEPDAGFGGRLAWLEVVGTPEPRSGRTVKGQQRVAVGGAPLGEREGSTVTQTARAFAKGR